AEGPGADQSDAAARLDLADRCIHLEVGQAVVDRLVAMALADPPGDDGDVRPLRGHLAGAPQPAGAHPAIAVYDLAQLDPRVHLPEPLEAGVARPGRREWDREVQLDDLRPERPRQVDAAVGRARVHVDDRVAQADHGFEAATE